MYLYKIIKYSFGYRYKNELGLFKCRKADKEWTFKKKSNNYIKTKAWDEDNF